MKIIALLPFKNEAWILEHFCISVSKIADQIIAMDDNSTDGGAEILKKYNALVVKNDAVVKSGWAEFSIREKLLELGRQNGGTHFICLDADEIFSDNFYPHAHDLIGGLEPGQSLWMDWVTLHGDTKIERIDGAYNGLNKNFIFRDDPKLQFKYVFLGVSRTPSDPSHRKVIDRKQGSVIHFQYVNLDRAMMKRAWYMCSEQIKADRSAIRINTTYDLNEKKIRTRALTADEAYDFEAAKSAATYDPSADWRHADIVKWFDEYGITFFEQLDIWNVKVLAEEFKTRTGREPKPKILPRWLIKINEWRNKTFNYLRTKKPTK